MMKQHLAREASPRAVEGPSTLLKNVRGRWSAPHVAIWLPVAVKVVAAALAAVGLAVIGTQVGAHAPAGGEPPVGSTIAAATAVSPLSDLGDAAAGVPPGVDGGIEPGSAILADGRVILNLASETELTQLPGIGPSRARAILTLRQRLTRFRAVEDLLRVKGIGRKTLRRLRPGIVLDRPPANQHSEPVSIPSPAEARSTGQ